MNQLERTSRSLSEWTWDCIEPYKVPVAEVLLQFDGAIAGPDSTIYVARACGDAMSDGMWQGWIEFIPLGAGDPVRSGRETTQPNRQDTVYWASGLTPVFLEGSLNRALKPSKRVAPRDPAPPFFDAPAPAGCFATQPAEGVLNPFTVYRKGEVWLRRQLSALSSWHLANIIAAHRLTNTDPRSLAAKDRATLVELIVGGVRDREGDAPAIR